MPDDETGLETTEDTDFIVDDTGESALSDAQGTGEDGGSPSSSASPSAPQFQEILTRLEASERRGHELETSLQRFVSGQQGPQNAGMPAAFQKPQEQWNVRDLWEATQWMQQQQMSQVTAEHATRGRLSPEVLGQGNDYDTVLQKYIAPLLQRNPEVVPFVQALPAEDRYMLGLLHEVHARSGGDLIKTIKTIRNALGARQEGARDAQNKVNQAARGAAMRVFQGGGARQTGRRSLQTAEDVWNLSDEEFRRTL